VQEKRTLADSARADERYALTIPQEAQNLVDFSLSADEILDVPDGSTMEKRIICTHDKPIVMPNDVKG